MCPTSIIVNTPRAMTGFAPDFPCVRTFSFDAGVRGSLKIADDLIVTIGASLRANILRPGNLSWDEDGASCGAGDDDKRREPCSQEKQRDPHAATQL